MRELERHPVYDTPALARALRTDGAVVVPAAIPRALCAEARAAIDSLSPGHWDEVHAAPSGFGTCRQLDRYLCVFNRDLFWLQFLDRPGFLELAELVLGGNCHVIGQTAWRSHPGYRGDDLHVDYQPLTWPEGGIRDDVEIPISVLTVHFHLNDVLEETGPTRIIPGSHRAGRVPGLNETDWNGRAAVAVTASPGDCLIFRSDVWHAGSQNHSRRTRYLLQVHYGRREMAQHFSPYLDWRFSGEVLAAASRRQKRLLGDHEPGPYD
jgi:hypothetical protein